MLVQVSAPIVGGGEWGDAGRGVGATLGSLAPGGSSQCLPLGLEES